MKLSTAIKDCRALSLEGYNTHIAWIPSKQKNFKVFLLSKNKTQEMGYKSLNILEDVAAHNADFQKEEPLQMVVCDVSKSLYNVDECVKDEFTGEYIHKNNAIEYLTGIIEEGELDVILHTKKFFITQLHAVHDKILINKINDL
jgi:hypothetical protein